MKRRAWPIWPAFCVSLLLASPAGAEGASPGAIPQDNASFNDRALASLMRMADTLARAKRFDVTIRATYDVMQEAGEKIEFAERRTVSLARPDGLRVETLESDGKRIVVAYDGKAITVFTPQENVYGRIDVTGTVDDAVHHVIQNLGIRLPMALLLVTTLPDELKRRLKVLDYVERNVLTPVPTDHLVGRTEEVDFQVWIPASGPALPQRITITYRNEDGQPQYRADLSDWILDPEMAAAAPAFSPPADAERIPFLVRAERPATDGAPTGPGDRTPGALK